jgi:NO-binding membrane sensor protein with MHYT domain
MIHVNNFSNGALNPVLAYLMSCLGCFLGLRCTTRARAHQGAARARWLAGAALAIGSTGIWVMHFIAMLGFTIPDETIRYNVPITILSMVIAVLVVGVGVFIVGFRDGTGPLVLGGVIIGLGVASMHYIGMSAIRVQDSLTYNPLLVAISVIIAIIAGTAALWAAIRLHSLLSTIVASLVMGVAVSGMHYTGMAALQVRAAPGLIVNTSATASALAFLLPLILGLCIVGFIFSTVIALSPTAAEILEEGELMARIARTTQHEPQVGLSRPPARSASTDPDPPQPGDLFRPHPSQRQPLVGGAPSTVDVVGEPGAEGHGRSEKGNDAVPGRRRFQPGFYRPLLPGGQALVAEQRDPGVVDGVATGRGLEHAVAVHGDVGRRDVGDDLLELRARAVVGDRLPVAGQVLRAHLPHAGPRAQALGGQLDVAGVADGGPDVRLVRRLVGAEPDVAVGPEDLGLAELGG